MLWAHLQMMLWKAADQRHPPVDARDIRRCGCSAMMAAILDFTSEAALPLSETAFPATGNSIGTKIVKIIPIEANIWQSVQFYIFLRPSWILVTGLQNQLQEWFYSLW